MKRCPKCNRTFQTDTQKFCTHDGGLLFAVDTSDLDKTVKFDSAKIHDAVPKPTTRDLEALKPHFDPEATVVTPPADDDATTVVRARDTQDLEPPQPTRHQIVPPPQAAVPPPPPASTSGPIATPAPSPPPTSTSGPITTSAPLPPPQASTSGPIAAPQVVQAQPSRPLPAARAKKSKVPLVLGILAVLFILGIGGLAGAYFLVVKPRLEARRIQQPVISEPSTTNPSLPTETPTEVATPSNEPPPYSPPADAVEFVNSKESLEGKLAEHYVDFSFYYPNRWERDPKSGNNFVEVHRQLPPNFTQESLAVSWYESAGSFQADQDSFHSFVESKSSQFAQSIDEYRKVSEGTTKIGSYDGYEFRFEGISQKTEKGQFKIWGRVIWLPTPDGSKNGITLLMLATSLAPELTTVDDVGVKGELLMPLESFRFGKK